MRKTVLLHSSVRANAMVLKTVFLLWYLTYPILTKGAHPNLIELSKKFSDLQLELEQSLINHKGANEAKRVDLDQFIEFNSASISKRSACDNGKGNYGINSFNFLAFILLTYNVVANVNNNLNNNNNNKNVRIHWSCLFAIFQLLFVYF